jgi:stage V sporulation protein B
MINITHIGDIYKIKALYVIICYIVSSTISLIFLMRKIDLKISFMDYVLKPLITVAGMGVSALYSYQFIHSHIKSIAVSTVFAISISVVVYMLMLLVTKSLTREEFKMLPYGDKISRMLVKMKLM